MPPGRLVHVSQSTRAMDHGQIGSAGDLCDPAELTGLQLDLRHADRKSRWHGYSQLHSGLSGRVHPGRSHWGNHCEREWILVAAIRLWGVLLSVRRDLLRWLLLRRGLWLSLCDALLQLCHGSLWLETD